jgi:hypothetical protein
MKWLAFVAAVAILAVGVQVAQSTPSGIPSRLANVEKRVRTLERKVNTLNSALSCINASAARLRGNPAAGDGYVYTPNSGATIQYSTALDGVRAGEPANVILATIDSACVSSAFKTAALGQHAHARVALGR